MENINPNKEDPKPAEIPKIKKEDPLEAFRKIE